MTQLAVDALNAEFAAAPGTSDGTLVGRNATTKVGFFGATPVARPQLAADADVDGVIAALIALGLVTQAS